MKTLLWTGLKGRCNMDDLIPIQYEGNDFEGLRLRVNTLGQIRTKQKEPRELDETDPDTLKLAELLRAKLPRGGAARIDSFGNLYISGKVCCQLTAVPALKVWDNPMNKRWTQDDIDDFIERYS